MLRKGVLSEKEKKALKSQFIRLWFSFNFLIFIGESILVIIVGTLIVPKEVYFYPIEIMMYILVIEGIALLIVGALTKVEGSYDIMKYAKRPSPSPMMQQKSEKEEEEEFTESVRIGKAMTIKLGVVCLIISGVYFLLLRNLIYSFITSL